MKKQKYSGLESVLADLMRNIKARQLPQKEVIGYEFEPVIVAGHVPFKGPVLMKRTPVYAKTRTPCGYCGRYDSCVESLDCDGLRGAYHPWCHARIIRQATAELCRRMGKAE